MNVNSDCSRCDVSASAISWLVLRFASSDKISGVAAMRIWICLTQRRRVAESKSLRCLIFKFHILIQQCQISCSRCVRGFAGLDNLESSPMGWDAKVERISLVAFSSHQEAPAATERSAKTNFSAAMPFKQEPWAPASINRAISELCEWEVRTNIGKLAYRCFICRQASIPPIPGNPTSKRTISTAW